MNLLQGIMAYPSFNMKLSILPQLLKLEEHFTQYERLGGKLPPDMRAAVLLKAISGPLKVHLNMTLNEGSSYGKIREAVLAYDTANTKWNESAALSFSSTSPMQSNLNDINGPAPMEVDRLKGKDKGKGKTKDLKGTKGKGKEEKGKSKGKGGKAVAGPKSEGKGKGGKEKGKGKGSTETCWTCGRPGHLAKDCWRVRQIEAPASNAPSSPPTVSPSTTTSIQPGSETTLKAVRRVSQPLIFDLRSYEESSGSIRMLREVEKPRKRAAVEFYNIATDDEEDYDGALRVNAIYEVPPEEEYQVDDGPTGDGDGVMATIVIDSGADAPIFPGHMLKQGRKARGMSPYLQDAQGRAIRTYGHRDIDIELKAEDDRLVVLKERVTFSDVVSQPILSFGHLLRSGWSISGEERCLVNGEVKVPIDLQNQSLVVQGQIRNVALASFVRALKVTLGEGLKKIEMDQLGWKRHGERWIGVHRGQHFQSPQFIPDMKHQGEVMSRSTVVKKGDQWQLVEMSEPVDGLEDQDEEIEELRGEYMAKIITFVAHSTTSQAPEDLGFEVEGFDYEASKRRRADEDDYAIPIADDEGEFEAVEGREIGGPVGPGGVDLEDQQVRFEVGVAIPDRIQVNGVELSLDSPLRTLRAACAFYQVGQSGSKRKCFGRLVEHQARLELLQARDLARHAQELQGREPREQALAKEPGEEEKRKHALTHVPYAPWCSACIKHRGRPDPHRRTGKARESGPVVSFDFSYTNARGIGPLGAPEESDQAQIGVPDEGGALWLIAVCSETGYLMGLPLRSKNQTSLIAHELLAFTQLLGHEKVTYYADNEPATRQVLKLLVQARTAIGLETHMRTTKLYDSSGNSLAENAFQRIRGVAASLMEEVATQTGLRFSAQHPLWSWCCRHSAWVLNRFQATQGTTSYELVYGRPYEGKVCRYGEVVHAYVKPKQGYKADPKSKIGICLGKSETQDCWIIGDGSRVFLSRSIRRVEQSWQSFLSCFKAFSAFSWEYQTNFGGRIVPSKR